MKKALKILIVIPLLYLVATPVYFADSINAKTVTGIEIVLSDSADYHFITKDHLYNLIFSSSEKIIGKPIKEVALENIEKNIKTIQELRTAEAYTTINGKLMIWAEQRRPIMRVMPDEGGDYFIDDEGVVIRRRNSYNPRLHIVVGHINISQAMLNGVSVLDTTIKNSTLRDIHYLVSHISKDNFWSAQIDQIYVDRNNKIELIPRVGNHIVRLGTVEDLEEKLINLETFYKDVLSEVGWNKYSVINLEFKNQIVCIKR
jgi:cell division protein FtsQ